MPFATQNTIVDTRGRFSVSGITLRVWCVTVEQSAVCWIRTGQAAGQFVHVHVLRPGRGQYGRLFARTRRLAGGTDWTLLFCTGMDVSMP